MEYVEDSKGEPTAGGLSEQRMAIAAVLFMNNAGYAFLGWCIRRPTDIWVNPSATTRSGS